MNQIKNLPNPEDLTFEQLIEYKDKYYEILKEKMFTLL